MYPRGKKAAKPLSPRAIRFADVFHSAKMPTPPTVFGHHDLMGKEPWHVLGNDTYGNCVLVSAAHDLYLWSLIGGRPRVRITTLDTLSDYHAITGFVLDDPATDQGTDMAEAAEYYRTVGIRDSSNNRHRIDSYVALTPGDTRQHALAAYLFGAVDIGLSISDEQDDQFDAGQPWTVTSTEPTGGHCVSVVGRDALGFFLVVTWGKLQRVAPSFIEKYMDEGYAYLSDAIIGLKGLSLEAFDKPMLKRMLARVSASPVQATAPAAAVALDLGPATPTREQFAVAFKVLRADIDKSGYGFMMSDAKLKPFSDEITIAVVGAA